MLNRILGTIAALLTVVVVGTEFAAAQTDATAAPLAAMQALAVLSGEWVVQSKYSSDDGKTWQESTPNRVSVAMRQKGKILAETPLEPQKRGFHVESLITFDQYRKVYRMAAIDDYWGLMDVYEGNLEGDALVLTNLKAGTFFPIGPDAWRAFRITLELKPEKRMMIVEKSDDGGKSWQPNFEIGYTAIGS